MARFSKALDSQQPGPSAPRNIHSVVRVRPINKSIRRQRKQNCRAARVNLDGLKYIPRISVFIGTTGAASVAPENTKQRRARLYAPTAAQASTRILSEQLQKQRAFSVAQASTQHQPPP